MPLGAARITLLAKTQVTAVAEVIRKKVSLTSTGNTQIDTGQYKFSGSSIQFDGAGGLLTAKSVNIGTGDFTIEAWVRLDVKAKRGVMAMVDGTNDIYIVLDNNNDYGFLLYSTAVSPNVLDAKNGGVTYTNTNINQWYHIAITRSGTSVKLWLDGSLMESGTSSANLDGTTLIIGSDSGTSYWDGNIDEVRISNTARYTANFTPSTTPFVNDENTLLLIHADGTDGSTYFEDDNGVRSKVGVTAVGNAKVSTAQSKFGGTSALFDGTGDYLQTSAHGSSSSTFTVEGWVRFTNVTTRSSGSFWQGDVGNSGVRCQVYAAFTGAGAEANRLYVALGVSGAFSFIYFPQTWAINTWYHIAVTRDSNNDIRAFINGTQIGSTQNNNKVFLNSTTTGLIGYNTYNGGDVYGYIDEFRISNTARYTANFTPSTSPFVNDANTLLLLHMDGTNASTYFEDDNGVRSKVGVTALGNAQVDTAQSKFGGASALFDGTGDYLALESQSAGPALIPATGEFTAEMWIMLDVNNATQALIHQYGYLGGSSSQDGRFSWYINTSGKLVLFVGGTGTFTITGSTTVSTGTWHHVAVTRDSNNRFDVWLNGTSEGNATSSISILSDAYTAIASASHSPGFYLDGWIDEVRISNTARYTSNFTAPTEPFQNDSNTLLLLHMDGTDASTVFVDDNGVPPDYSY